MNGIFYNNTITTLPGWVEPLHLSQPIGYAYETATHFVHLYGKDHGLNVISVGLTVIEQKKVPYLIGYKEYLVLKIFNLYLYQLVILLKVFGVLHSITLTTLKQP